MRGYARPWSPSHSAAEVGRYAEQPYTSRGEPPPDSFERVRTSLRDRFAKWRAIREYRSQLPLLAMRRSLTRGPHVAAFSTEAISWQVTTLPPR